jgi:hypothetical protein
MDDLERRFSAHVVTPEQAESIALVRSATLSLARTMADECPAGRELALALTNLEQALFWANAAIARDGK